jgi:hypothetical protein
MNFPRQLTETIACSDDDRKYDMPYDTQTIVSVEYPKGEDPPEYLKRRAYTHPDFWQVDGYYDFVRRDDATDQPELWISEKPSTGESIDVEYLGPHAWLDDDTDECTVPERHLELLVLFVRWKASEEVASEEGANPDPSNLLSSTLEVNAYRAERAYRKELDRLQAAESETAITGPWQMDKYDRTY